MKRIFTFLIALLIFVNSPYSLFAQDGFSVFKFNDDVEDVVQKGSGLCSFDKPNEDPRWLWKSTISCRGFDYKGIKTQIYFQFAKEDLVRIFVVSKEIKDYFLIRQNQFSYLVPKSEIKRDQTHRNLADQLMLSDKVHRFGPGLQRTDFYYDGKWEWELLIEKPSIRKKDKDREEDQLDDEEDQGLEGWKQFKFEEELDEVRLKLEGLCQNMDIRASSVNLDRKKIYCKGYRFSDDKILVIFSFHENELVKIELLFDSKWYSNLLPQLKRKYGKPFYELSQNELFYPFIEFPAVNIVMYHRPDILDPKKIQVVVAYQQQGYIDESSDFYRKQNQAGKKLIREKSSDEKIYDGL